MAAASLVEAVVGKHLLPKRDSIFEIFMHFPDGRVVQAQRVQNVFEVGLIEQSKSGQIDLAAIAVVQGTEDRRDDAGAVGAGMAPNEVQQCGQSGDKVFIFRSGFAVLVR
jgi:hypothetical protein